MENILYYKKQIVITLSIFIVFLLASVFIYYGNEKQGKERKVNTVENIAKKDGNNESEEVTEDNTEENTSNSKYVYIDVKGYVSNPGVYKLKKGSIVNDVLLAAGGIKEDADTICVNLSKKVFDEMVIYVHSKEEIKEMESNGKINKDDINICPNIENAAFTPYKEESENNVTENNISTENEKKDSTPNEKININTSDIDKLTTLPNIGKSKAQAIISYREKNGDFKSIEDIIKVSGIGESTFQKIKDYITI